MQQIFVKPKPGLKVREPNPPYALLPEEGKLVPDDSYWNRRLKAGDVERAEPPTHAATVTSEES